MHDPPAPADDQERLRTLLEECIDRIATSGAGAEDDVLARHPIEAPLLRERLARLRQAGLLDHAGATDRGFPEHLGEFRLIRRIGAGGMGVVYLAEQESLRRQVALKLVRPEQLFFPGARERFRREVETIARLSDPGIVPIHAVGEDAGVPYFAMALVEGATLAEVLAAVRGTPVSELDGASIARSIAAHLSVEPPAVLPGTFRGSWPQACARILARMADAVAHAHERAVIHRDLKPSNAMVTLDGRVVLLDFGLAATQGAMRITRSGAALGTLHAMAPEQLSDGVLDARTDVYALGVTLHELLTLRPPYDGPSADSVRAAILAGACPSPRRANRAVPGDLATICARAMDSDPARRYASALELRDDLIRFLEHRAIHARPAGPWLAARRFARRRPAAAAIVLAVPILAAVALLVAARVRDAESAAEQNLQDALRAIDGLRRRALDERLLRTPGLDAVRAGQLEESVALLRKLRAEHGEHGDVRRGFAIGLGDLAELSRSLGHAVRAEELLDEAERELRALLAARPGDAAVTADLANVLVLRGLARRETGRLDEAIAIWGGAIAMLEPLDGDHGPPELLRALAALLANRGTSLRAKQDLAGAERDLRASLALGERLESVATDQEHLASRLRTASNLAAVVQLRGDATGALAIRETQLADAIRLHGADQGDPELRRELARAYASLAKSLVDLGRKDDAARASEASLAAFEALSRDFAERVEYRWEHDLALFAAAQTALRATDARTAEAHLARAIERHEAFLRDFPHRAETRRELATMHGTLADLTGADSARRDESERATQRALALYDELLASPTAEPVDRVQQALVRYNRAIVRRAHHDARGLREDCAAIHDVLTGAWRDRAPFAPSRDVVFQSCRMLAEAEAELGDNSAALRALASLVELALIDPSQLRALGAQLHLDEREDFLELARRLNARD